MTITMGVRMIMIMRMMMIMTNDNEGFEVFIELMFGR